MSYNRTERHRKEISKRFKGIPKTLQHRLNLSKASFGRGNCITPFETRLRQSLSYKLFRLRILKRDRYTCQACKTTNIPSNLCKVHHKISTSERFDLLMESSNVITFCQSCHSKIHWQRRIKNEKKR